MIWHLFHRPLARLESSVLHPIRSPAMSRTNTFKAYQAMTLSMVQAATTRSMVERDRTHCMVARGTTSCTAAPATAMCSTGVRGQTPILWTRRMARQRSKGTTVLVRRTC